ncbi:MAG: hypothetical protein ACR2G4_09955 [Pyrinomonadaceae bacterium]
MREFTVEQSSMNCRWTFDRMLPSLPGPGTHAFAELVKGLHPHGLLPSGVTVDSSSSRMSDVILGILLLDNRVGIRITPSFLEMFVNELFEDDKSVLENIAGLIFTALIEIDPESEQGKIQVRLSSHLNLDKSEDVAFLQDMLNVPKGKLSLIPDAAAYKVNLPQSTMSKDLRVVIAKSLAYEDAIFLDVAANYTGPVNITHLSEWISSDFDKALAEIGLRPKEAMERN